MEHLETLYKQFVFQNRENIDLKQTNKILVQERKAQKEVTGCAIILNVMRPEVNMARSSIDWA